MEHNLTTVKCNCLHCDTLSFVPPPLLYPEIRQSRARTTNIHILRCFAPIIRIHYEEVISVPMCLSVCLAVDFNLTAIVAKEKNLDSCDNHSFTTSAHSTRWFIKLQGDYRHPKMLKNSHTFCVSYHKEEVVFSGASARWIGSARI